MSLILETVQWSSLPDINEIERINAADRNVLEEIREVLVRHNHTDRFGICLLHKHFELAENEMAVEYTDVEGRTSTVVVEPKAADPGFIETVWRFKVDGPVAVTECVQGCSYSGTHVRVHRRVGK
jgi:hypothetical protein